MSSVRAAAPATWLRRPFTRAQRRVDLDVLARSAIFAQLTPRELSGVIDQLDVVELPAGANLELDTVCVVLEGRSSVDGRELAAGGHAGVASALGGSRSEQLWAQTASRVVLLPRERLQSLERTQPLLSARIVRALALTLIDRVPAEGEDQLGALEITVRRGEHMTRAPAGTRARAFLADASAAVAASIDGRPVALDAPVVCDATLEPIARESADGRVIGLRTLGLVMLASAARILPTARVGWGSTAAGERILTIEAAEIADPARTAAELERAANAAIARDQQTSEEVWSIDRARHHFLSVGWDDAAALLRMRRDPTLTVLVHEDLVAPRLGPAISNAGALGTVRVEPHPAGFLIRHELEVAVPQHAATPLGGASPQVGTDMAEAQRRWLQHLGITCVGAFNDACIAGRVEDVVRISEGFHEKRVSQLAELAAARRGTLRCIRMAGPSASGKSTFIERLKVQLEVEGLHPVLLSLDDYYVDREQTPRDAAGELDFESIDALDRRRLAADVDALLAGRTVRTSRFDFLAGKAQPTGGPELTLGERDILLVEGLHALSPELFALESAPAATWLGIFVHPATTLPFDRLNHVAAEDVRLLRRIVRDRYRRGYSAAENILRWASVRRGEHTRIFPSARFADAVFDSSLVYELAVLKVYAERYLLEVPERHPAFATALRLRGLIEPFVAIYPDHVPPNSILREFIGH